MPSVVTDANVVWLDNGAVRLGLVPALGGRMLSLRTTGGPELLWRNERLLDADLRLRAPHRPHRGQLGDWLNYGGDKTWPAPQGWDGPRSWPGPPDPVLDSGPWTLTEAAGVVTLTSGDDPHTGLRLSREFRLEPGRPAYRLELRATNVSDRPVRWALWNVTQLDGDGPGHTDIDGPPEVTNLLAGTGLPPWQTRRGGVRVPHADVVGKLGFPAAAGRIAHTGPNGTLTQTFTVQDGATYPDRGSRVEVWSEYPLDEPLAELGDLDPPARIVEIEVLGPVAELAPGQGTSLRLDCHVEAP